MLTALATIMNTIITVSCNGNSRSHRIYSLIDDPYVVVMVAVEVIDVTSSLNSHSTNISFFYDGKS